MKTLGLAFALAASLASAQDTGSIGGVVADATGAVLPDCVVQVASENGGVSRRQRTGGRGGYGFSGLPVGSYRVRFDLTGFGSAEREGVQVEAGTHAELRVTLQVQGIAVFTEAGSTDRKRTGLAGIAEQPLLQSVPTGRSLWSVLELTPGLVTDRIDVGGSASGQQSAFSAAGTSSSQNQYYLNGVNVTDPTALGASATYYAYDAFEEVQISTAGHDAETQPPGVVVNIILKGGGNQLEGGASFYFENDTLQSDNLDDQLRAKGVPPSNPLESFYDVSAELGGPIVRDRAFFYASYARQRIAPFAIGFFLPGGERGVDRTDLSTVVARTSLSLEARGSLGFLFFQNRKLRPYRDAGRFRPAPATALHQDSNTGVFQGLYSRLLGDQALFDARFSLVDLDFPLGEDPELPDDAYSRIELASGVRSGGPGSNELFSRSRWQANAALFLFADDFLSGSHDLKFGWEGGWNRARTGYGLTGAILYRDFFGAPIQVEVYSEPLTTVNDGGSQGFFVKDSYVRGRLVLNLGARFDRISAGYPDQSRPAGRWEDFFLARGLPESTAGAGLLSFSSIAPRLGFTFSLTSDGRTLLRGSYSRFYHQIGTDLVSSQNPNGRGAALFRFGDENGNRVLDPGEIDLETPLAVSLPALNEIDPEIAQPRTDELSLGLDREIGSGLALSVTLLYRQDHTLIDDVNVGVPASAFQEEEAFDPGRDLAMGTADDSVLPVFNQARETLGQDRFQLTNPEGLESRYRGFAIEASKRARRWQVQAALSLSESEGYLPGPGLESQGGAPLATPLFNNPNTLTNALGRTFWDRPRILRFSGFYEWKWGMRFASAYRYQTGQPMYRSILASATREGVPLAQGPVEILAEPQGAAVQPSVHLLDVRAEKGFSLGNAGRLDLIFDLFNSFNANTATEIASRRGAFGAILEVLPPRVARIGVRYRFGSN